MNFVAKVFPRSAPHQSEPYNWTVQASFTVFGHPFKQIDLTPAIGICLLIGTTLLIAQWS